MASHYWSSTTNAYYPYIAYVVDFYYGHGSNRDKLSHEYRNYVRAVRGGKAVDLADAVLVMKVLTGDVPEAATNLAADIDGDNKIGMVELVYILQHVAGF